MMVEPGVYQHYRRGKYLVLFTTVAHHDVEGHAIPRVVYLSAETGERLDATVEHFTAMVPVDGGTLLVPRFQRLAVVYPGPPPSPNP